MKRFIVFLGFEHIVGLANTHKEIGIIIGCSRQHISNSLRKKTDSYINRVSSYGKKYIVIDKVEEFDKLHPNYPEETTEEEQENHD